jgi:hypothetical protein
MYGKTYALCKTASLSQSAKTLVDGRAKEDVVVIELKNWDILAIAGELLNSCHILSNPLITGHTAYSGIHHDSVILGRLGQGTASTA